MATKRPEALRKKRRLRKIYKKEYAKRPQTHQGKKEKRLSPSDFSENVRRRLNTQGYVEELMETMLQEAEPFFGSLTALQRKQIENFLYGAMWKLSNASLNDQDKMLRKSKAWKEMNVNAL